MRMIDADMLADGLKLHRQSTDQKHETDRQWAVGYNAGLERALYSISYAPTLTPPNEWVGVEDAFPPEHESMLCIVSGKPKPNITLEDAYQLGSWNKADGWIIDEWLDWEGANVTWWMKLPEPPYRRPREGEVNA